MQPIINYAICAVSAYLIGSLSFGILISKLFIIRIFAILALKARV